MWFGALVIPALIFSILQISWRWVIIYFLIGVLGTYLVLRLGWELFDLYYLTIGISIIGIFLAELYKRGHEYTIRNYRIIAHLGFLGAIERNIFYSKITEIFVDQGFLGKLFNFGSIIPITPSGIGTGEDAAKVTVGTGAAQGVGPSQIGVGVGVTGEKSVTVPRGRSAFILYGVPNPDEIKRIILENMKKAEPTTYLERTVELLEKIAKEEEEKE